MSATGDTAGLITTSSPTATLRDVVADGLDDAGDVAPGHVRQRRLGQPAGDPQVHVVEGAGDDADLHVVAAERRQVDRAPAVRPGRLVEDPRVHRTVLSRRRGAAPIQT